MTYAADWQEASRLALQWEREQDGRAAWEAWLLARKYPSDDAGMAEVLRRIAPFIDRVAREVLTLDGRAVKRPEPWRAAVGLSGHKAKETRRKIQAAAWRAFHAGIAAAIAEKREPHVTHGSVLAAAADAGGVSERTAREYIDETMLRDLPRPEAAPKEPPKQPRRVNQRNKPEHWRKGAFSKKR